jgi:hypothetical protein
MKQKLEQHKPVLMPSIDPKQYDNVVFPPDIAAFKKRLEDQYFTPHKLTAPGYVLKPLVEAITADQMSKSSLLERARQNAEMHYLASWARGVIKVKTKESKPMSAATKERLRKAAETKRKEKQAQKELVKKQTQSNKKIDKQLKPKKNI